MARRVPKKWVRGPADELAIEAGCWFEIERAQRVRKFFQDFLRHSKGRWAGQPFDLLPWQWDRVIAPLFGWVRPPSDETPEITRRYRRGYFEVAKKNGKSTLAAGLSLYLLVGDGEMGAEVYSAAGDRKQASIVHNEAASMVRKSPDLSNHLQVVDSTKRIVFPKTGSVYVALAADANLNEGLNISGLVVDELHAQPNRKLWDALAYGGAARLQPLTVAITTAGSDRESICWEQHEYAQGVLDGTIKDWEFLPYVCGGTDDDNWTAPRTWRKANPSLGVTVKVADMQAACAEAQASPRKENSFRRYRLSQWTEQDVRWLSMAKWDACSAAVDVKPGMDVAGGLDLSSRVDITAFSLVFRDGDVFSTLSKFWLPGSALHGRDERLTTLYRQWADEGLLTLTDGHVVDYSRVKADILTLCEQYGCADVAVDRWQAEFMAQLFTDEGLDVVAFGQGWASMSTPTKELEALIIDGRLRHGGNPVLRWMASNVAVQEDAAGNQKPSKAKSSQKIDGIVTTIMGLGRLLVRDRDEGSVYDRRGLLTV